MMNHRVALVSLVALLLAAAAPLAYAWARLLPEESPPFQTDQQKGQGSNEEDDTPGRRHDPFAIFLLAGITFSYLLKFPGVPVAAGLQLLARSVPPEYLSWTLMAGRAFFVVVPGLAAAYSALRPNPFRVSLIVGGILVLALWLANPYLIATLKG